MEKMVKAEFQEGSDPTLPAPTPPSQRGRLGYSPQTPSSEYSGSPDRPVFGLGPARHYFPEGEVEIPAAPFRLEKRRQYPEEGDVVPYREYGQYFVEGGYRTDDIRNPQNRKRRLRRGLT